MRVVGLFFDFVTLLGQLPAASDEQEYCWFVTDEFADFGTSFLEGVPLDRSDTVGMLSQFTVRMEGAHGFHYRDANGRIEFDLREDGRSNGLGILTERHMNRRTMRDGRREGMARIATGRTI